MPTRVTGTDPVSDREAGVPDRPIPTPTKQNASTTTQNEAVSVHRNSIVRKPASTNT